MGDEPKLPKAEGSEAKEPALDTPLPAWLTEGLPVPAAPARPEKPIAKKSLADFFKTWPPWIAILVTLSLFLLTYQFTKGGNESQVRSANLAALPLVPNLEAKLVVDDVSGGQFAFHFDVKNIGKLRARNIGYLYSMPRGLTLGDAADAKHPRDLAPDSSMSLRPEDRRQPLVPVGGAPLKLLLVLTYSAELEGKETWHRRRMVFAVYPDVKVGSLSMEEGSDHNEKLGLQQEVAALKDGTVLDGQHGSASIDFDVSDQKTDQVTLFCSSNTLALVFDPASTSMLFQIWKTGTPSLLQLECRLREPSPERHHVSISWDEYGAALRCDGIEFNGSRLPP